MLVLDVDGQKCEGIVIVLARLEVECKVERSVEVGEVKDGLSAAKIEGERTRARQAIDGKNARPNAATHLRPLVALNVCARSVFDVELAIESFLYQRTRRIVH